VVQRLVRFLLVHRDRRVSEDELLEAFWPDRHLDGARRSLHVAISRARRVLDWPDSPSVIEVTDRVYRLSLRAGDSVDADEFETKILFLVSAHNSLSQLAWIALTELGHEVRVAVVDSAAGMEAAVFEHQLELVVCPFLKRMIPESVWAQHPRLIVHPGPVGDPGPSSLDSAVELGARECGVTVLVANEEFDAGTVCATRSFRMRSAGKSSLYRHEVRRGAIEALIEAVGTIATGAAPGESEPGREGRGGRARPPIGQEVRAIDWEADRTDVVVRKIRAGEGHPGVLDTVEGVECHLFGVHPEWELRGAPGEIIVTRTGAICRATVDGAVWITHLQRAETPGERFFKLPATQALALAGLEPQPPDIPAAVHASLPADQAYREIAYAEHDGVGYLRFEFYNGAMSNGQCQRLLDAYRYARRREQTRVIVLMGGEDFFSNGIHLNVIEAAPDPALESGRNLNAIEDLVREIIQTDSHLVISALGGDATAGGVPLALAADLVVARNDVVLNPYYQHMGGLYGSEYWTYLLPRRVGAEMTWRLTSPPFSPLGAREAVRIGVLDDAFGASLASFHTGARVLAERLARDSSLPRRLEQKRARRARDDQTRPLKAYREQELARCHACFSARIAATTRREPGLSTSSARSVPPTSQPTRPAAWREGGPMLTPVHAHPMPGSSTSARVPPIERAAVFPFAANEDGLYELMPDETARRFADLRATLREAKRSTARRPETEPDSLTPAAARLQAATRHYEQHVLAWYALGRIGEARAAREAIAHCREALTAEDRRNANSRADYRTIMTRRRPLDRERLIHN
jgi:putative two-component system hydrogenase maturation factor HypX/HoxX